MSRKSSNRQRADFSQSNQFEEVSAPPAVLQASMVDQFSINEMRIRLAQEEADRVALEEHIFLLERRNQSILVELQTLRIEKQQLLALVEQLESKAHRAQARQPNNEQQMTALYMDVHRLRAERDDARRQLMSVAKSAEPDFLQSYLQLENDFNGLLAEKASLQQRVIELSRFEQQLIQHKLDTAELREQYDDLDFRVRHELEPHIEVLECNVANFLYASFFNVDEFS
jgi:chromosome segregation ATPase